MNKKNLLHEFLDAAGKRGGGGQTTSVLLTAPILEGPRRVRRDTEFRPEIRALPEGLAEGAEAEYGLRRTCPPGKFVWVQARWWQSAVLISQELVSQGEAGADRRTHEPFRMKIWLPLIATATGAEVYTRRLAAGLASRGHDVQLEIVPHRFQYLPWLAGLRPPKGTDVILANSWNAAAFAGPAPLVTVVHHVVHDPALSSHKSIAQRAFHNAFVRPMERQALRRSAAVIAVSKTTATAVRSHLRDTPIDVVLNGVDTEYFRPAAHKQPCDPSAPINLLFVGKPSRRKGFDLVAEVVTRLGDACRLTCVGPRPERGMPSPPARYLGQVAEATLRHAYQEADLLLFPSRLEGFGYAAAEALACGLPVVCSEGGAVAEIAPSPACGIACPPDDPASFAEAVLDLGRDQSRLDALRQTARSHAVACLGARRWITGTEAVLARVIE